MNDVKEREPWYHHEMIVCTLVVLGIFGMGFIVFEMFNDPKLAAYTIAIIFLGVILLPAIDPIKSGIKWIKNRKTKEADGQ